MTGGQQGTLYFLETGTWEQTSEVVLEPNEIALVDLVVHPDGRRFSSPASPAWCGWLIWKHDKIDGDPLDASGTQLQGVALSPDGSLVVATSRDGGIRLWDRTAESDRANPNRPPLSAAADRFRDCRSVH